MPPFPIRTVNRSQAVSVETLGSKPKFWSRENDKWLLFKAEDRGKGEDWAEVIAAELRQLLGLPHVHYELASEFSDQTYIRPGVVSENMVPPPSSLVLGNELMLSVDPDYPKEQRFRVAQHTVGAVARILENLQIAEGGTFSKTYVATAMDAITVTVVQLNKDAPIQNRLLCEMRACWPVDFRPCSREDFLPIPSSIPERCDA